LVDRRGGAGEIGCLGEQAHRSGHLRGKHNGDDRERAQGGPQTRQRTECANAD
jgi:hypothetical protein